MVDVEAEIVYRCQCVHLILTFKDLTSFIPKTAQPFPIKLNIQFNSCLTKTNMCLLIEFFLFLSPSNLLEEVPDISNSFLISAIIWFVNAGERFIL